MSSNCYMHDNPGVDGSTQCFTSQLPLEMVFKIFSLMDIPTVRAVRLVSRKWKAIVETSRNLNFSCCLTDKTLATAVNSGMQFSCVQISNFSGTGNKVVSATRGTGRLFGTAKQVIFKGKNIKAEEASKMIKYGVHSLETMTFKESTNQLILAVISSKLTFSNLKKLVISYAGFPRASHTRVLNKLSTPYNVISLPVLDHFKISYELKSVDDIYNQRYRPTPNEIFWNYMAITKVVTKFRNTLKTVEILRNEIVRTALVLQVQTDEVQATPVELALIERYLQQFEELTLDKLHIAPLIDEGERPWILETNMLRRQRNLENLSINKKLCTPRLGAQSLETILPVNISGFNFAHIELTCIGNASIDLALFAQCPNLKTLWLAFYKGVRLGPTRQNSLHFTNLEMIPKGLKSLHLKSSQQESIIIHQQSIISREQLRWVIDNMLELESLWVQLITEETNELENNQPVVEVVERVDLGADHALPGPLDEDEMEIDVEAHEAHQLVDRLNQDLNANANVNKETFRDLLAMPKVRDFKLDMYKAGQMSAILEIGTDGNPWILPMGSRVSLDTIREYVEVCEETPNATFTSQFATFFPFGFVELTISKT